MAERSAESHSSSCSSASSASDEGRPGRCAGARQTPRAADSTRPKIEIDAEALRLLPRDVCARLRVLPLSVVTDGRGKLLRIAMADPTDTSAIAEIEQLTHCDVEVQRAPAVGDR